MNCSEVLKLALQTSYRWQSSTYVSTKHSVTAVTVLAVRRNSLWAQRHSWLGAKNLIFKKNFYAVYSLVLAHSPWCLHYCVSFFIDLSISSFTSCSPFVFFFSLLNCLQNNVLNVPVCFLWNDQWKESCDFQINKIRLFVAYFCVRLNATHSEGRDGSTRVATIFLNPYPANVENMVSS